MKFKPYETDKTFEAKFSYFLLLCQKSCRNAQILKILSRLGRLHF